MSASISISSVMITGANAGIGKEVARQLAMRPGVQRIYLACRSEVKARAAKQDLEKQTGKSCFRIVVINMSDLASVRAAMRELDAPLDALVMNAGGSGGKIPMALTRDGVTELFASNVLGHVVLLEALMAAGMLSGTAVYLGSEAARGVPRLGIKRPSLPTSSVQDFIDVITGKDFIGKKFNAALAYAEVKYIAALWMAASAHRQPALRLVTISPGNTQGTEIAGSMPPVVRILVQRIVMPFVAPLFGLAHSLETGAARIVAGLTDPSFESGIFYASAENKMIGPVMDQSKIFPDLANLTYQQNADEAIHTFI